LGPRHRRRHRRRGQLRFGAGRFPRQRGPMSAAGFVVPPGACDCHVHVFPDVTRYPFVPKRVYTPPPAPVADLDAYLMSLGLGRVIVIQPSVYGTDNAALLDSIDGLGLDRARGVAVIDDGVSDAALDDM